MRLDVDTRLSDIGVVLPPPSAAARNVVPAVVFDDILYISRTYGTIKDASGVDCMPMRGKIGAELTVDDGYASARQMAINHLAKARALLGDLSRIERAMHLVGYVNAAPGFHDASSVLNGASDFLIELLGKEYGCHARVAHYQSDLARDAPVAGEIMFRLRRK